MWTSLSNFVSCLNYVPYFIFNTLFWFFGPNLPINCTFGLKQKMWISDHKYWQHQYPFIVILDRYDGSCTLDDLSAMIFYLSNKIYTPNKTKDSNEKVCNMVIRFTKSKTLTKYFSCVCRYKFKKGKCNSNQKRDKDKYVNGKVKNQ